MTTQADVTAMAQKVVAIIHDPLCPKRHPHGSPPDPCAMGDSTTAHEMAAQAVRVVLEAVGQVLEEAEAATPQPVGLDLQTLATTNAERCKRWHPEGTEPWTLADWSNAMCGEAGEAANLVKKLRRIETGTDSGPWTIPHATIPGREVVLDKGQRSRILAKGIGLELADVVIYADLLAQELAHRYGGYTLSSLVVTKFNAVSHRQGYPERLVPPGQPRPGDVLRTRDEAGQVVG